MELVIDRLEKKMHRTDTVANCQLLDDRRETNAICRTQDETMREKWPTKVGKGEGEGCQRATSQNAAISESLKAQQFQQWL